MWLDGRNIKTYHPTSKLAPKHHRPFPIQRVLSTINYQLMIPEQWKIHDVFHVNLLTPYRETEFHSDTLQDPLGRINAVFNYFTTYPGYVR